MKWRILFAVIVALLPGVASATTRNVWLTQAEVRALDTTGVSTNDAWRRMRNAAIRNDWPPPDLKDQNGHHGQYVLAAALAWCRDSTKYTSLRAKVRDNLMAAKATLDDAAEYNCCGSANPNLNTQALWPARQMPSYIAAADLIDFKAFDTANEAIWRAWLSDLRTHLLPQSDPNWQRVSDMSNVTCSNQGAHGLAAMIAADIYLDDLKDLAKRDSTFRAYADRRYYPTFIDPTQSPDRDTLTYFYVSSDPSQDDSFYNGIIMPDSLNWTAVNPPCQLMDLPGHTCGGALQDFNGCLVEDFSRSRPDFTGVFCPADSDSIGGHSYSWNALEALVVCAEMLTNKGYTAWNYGSSWVKRAADFQLRRGWGIAVAPPSGISSSWATAWILNKRYGSPAPYPAYRISSGYDAFSVATSMHWTNWTHWADAVTGVRPQRTPVVVGRPGIYDLQGRRVEPTRPGVYLERKADGTVRRFVLLPR